MEKYKKYWLKCSFSLDFKTKLSIVLGESWIISFSYIYIVNYLLMTKTELIARIAELMNVSKKQAAQFVSTFSNVVIEGVKKDGEVRIQGFGTFKLSKRSARTGVNPQDPTKKIQIPARNVPTFKAGSDFKKAVNS